MDAGQAVEGADSPDTRRNDALPATSAPPAGCSAPGTLQATAVSVSRVGNAAAFTRLRTTAFGGGARWRGADVAGGGAMTQAVRKTAGETMHRRFIIERKETLGGLSEMEAARIDAAAGSGSDDDGVRNGL